MESWRATSDPIDPKDARIAELERKLASADDDDAFWLKHWRARAEAAEQSALTAKRDGMIEAADELDRAAADYRAEAGNHRGPPAVSIEAVANGLEMEARLLRTRAASLTGEGAGKPIGGLVQAFYDMTDEKTLPTGWEAPADAPAYRDKRRWMMEWKPIETAPKDGTHILCCDEDGAIYRAAFDEECEAWGAMCGQPVVYTPEPTRWMPLPDDTDASP